jgi:hypothetical protein
MSAGRSQSAEGAAMINDYSTEDALDLRALADEPTDDDIEIGRLARLSPIEYERDRKIAAEQMGVRTTILDRLVAVERDNIDGDGAKQGRGLTLPEPQPWPDPVEGIELLGGLSAAIKRHVVMPDHVADAVAMWAVHTYIVECFGISPRLAITSPEKGCGKTTLLDVVSRLVWRPLSTAAAIFRVVDILQPTLLIDEADTFLRDNEDLRGVLNSGHRHGGSVLRTVGDDHEPRPFATYSACAIALIGKLPATLADRSITAELRRRLASEAVEPFRHDRTTHLDMLARKAARWASDNADCVRGADPDIPAGIFNRVADNWRPLLAIADAAGGDWPERARRVLAAMAGANDDQSTGAMLFADIRDIFSEREADRLPSSELAEALVAIEGRAMASRSPPMASPVCWRRTASRPPRSVWAPRPRKATSWRTSRTRSSVTSRRMGRPKRNTATKPMKWALLLRRQPQQPLPGCALKMPRNPIMTGNVAMLRLQTQGRPIARMWRPAAISAANRRLPPTHSIRGTGPADRMESSCIGGASKRGSTGHPCLREISAPRTEGRCHSLNDCELTDPGTRSTTAGREPAPRLPASWKLGLAPIGYPSRTCRSADQARMARAAMAKTAGQTRTA